MVVYVVNQAHPYYMHQFPLILHIRPEVSLEKYVQRTQSLATHVVNDLATTRLVLEHDATCRYDRGHREK